MKVVLAKRPFGFPEKDTWEWKDEKVQSLKDGEILIKVLFISLDPAMRGWLDDRKSYIRPVQLNEVMRCGGVGKVVESKNSRFQEGDFLYGMTGVQKYCVTDGRGFVKVDPNLLPLPKYLGALGMPGFTAYFGLLEVGKPKPGETVVVSGAAGAVGSVVGQIAKIKGCRAVGIAGGPDKCKYVVDELGFDHCIDYKNQNVRLGLKEACPSGIDIYFDNVGGEILDHALARLNFGARVPICGAISQYNVKVPPKGPANYLSLLMNSARMEGFIVTNYSNQYGEAAIQMGQWLAEGLIQSREHVDVGIENFYESFKRLFSGEKNGKLVLQIA